jgi:hypothetical protein
MGITEDMILQDHPAYHQAITGEEAVKRLRECGEHCYLTRYSSAHACYVLSSYKPQDYLDPVIMHFKIIIEDDGTLKIDGKRLEFDAIQSLLEYYGYTLL